jgi:hypothetical protein
MTMTAPKRHWGTDDELKFLDGLGKHAPELGQKRSVLLSRYRMALSKRTDWTGIDKHTIMRYLDAAALASH